MKKWNGNLKEFRMGQKVYYKSKNNHPRSGIVEDIKGRTIIVRKSDSEAKKPYKILDVEAAYETKRDLLFSIR